MANLAIKGHATRGKEVIEILEMLGGINTYACKAVRETCFYFIVEGEIDYDLERYITDEYTIFTLEEFLEKFPYKVGDRVLYKTYGIYSKIKSMCWNKEKEQVFYRLDSKKLYVASGDELHLCKEETIDEASNAVFDSNAQCCDIMNRLIKEETMEEIIKIDIPNGYEFFGVDDNNKIVLTKKQPQYPKTYDECCDVLKIPNDERYIDIDVPLDYNKLLYAFTELFICRNAYWKIAGEQMGLGEPWKPDWLNVEQDKFVLYTHDNVICLNRFVLGHNVLAFPTAEMRDAFLENFKKLIESCKELL